MTALVNIVLFFFQLQKSIDFELMHLQFVMVLSHFSVCLKVIDHAWILLNSTADSVAGQISTTVPWLGLIFFKAFTNETENLWQQEFEISPQQVRSCCSPGWEASCVFNTVLFNKLSINAVVIDSLFIDSVYSRVIVNEH